MTEVVRCKSKREVGVDDAAQRCGPRYLDRTLALSPALLLVVVGAKARDRARSVMGLAEGFGQRDSAPKENLQVLEVGGRRRVVAYLPHFSGMEPRRSFTERYGQHGVAVLRAVALQQEAPEAVEGLLQ